MRFNVKLLETDSIIINLILENIRDILTKAIFKAIPDIEDQLKNIIATSLRQEPEYTSLIGGQLQAEFGIPNVLSVDNVIQQLVDTIKFESSYIKTTRSGLSGGFKITMMKSDDMDGVIYSENARVIDNDNDLPWLEWLLFKNNAPIVKNYNVKFGSSPYSRSGLAIMVPSSNNWRVPPEFAGSTRNNWTTRAISRAEPAVYGIIKKAIEDNL